MRATNLSLKRAKPLRRAMTRPEVWLWTRLRERRDGEPVFRRQHPMGPYILDFYCPQAKFCVEIDGWVHNMGHQGERDDRRDKWLASQGVEVLHISAADVFRNVDEMADMIRRTALHHARRR